MLNSDIHPTGRSISADTMTYVYRRVVPPVAFIVLGAVVVPRLVETLAHGRASLLDWLPSAVWIAVTVAFFYRGRGLADVTLTGDTLSVVRSDGVERISISSVRRIELGVWYDRPRTIRLYIITGEGHQQELRFIPIGVGFGGGGGEEVAAELKDLVRNAKSAPRSPIAPSP